LIDIAKVRRANDPTLVTDAKVKNAAGTDRSKWDSPCLVCGGKDNFRAQHNTSDGVCGTSLETIGDELGIDKATAQRQAQGLRDDGHLENITPNLRDQPGIYRDTGKFAISILVSFAQRNATFQAGRHGANLYTVLPGRGDIQGKGGDIQGTERVTPMSPESSYNHQEINHHRITNSAADAATGISTVENDPWKNVPASDKTEMTSTCFLAPTWGM
jgi:hypothetical protein